MRAKGGATAARHVAKAKNALRDSTSAMKDTMVATIAQAKPPPSGRLGSISFSACTYVVPLYLPPPATTVPTKMDANWRNTRKKRACLRGGAAFVCA